MSWSRCELLGAPSRTGSDSGSSSTFCEFYLSISVIIIIYDGGGISIGEGAVNEAGLNLILRHYNRKQVLSYL